MKSKKTKKNGLEKIFEKMKTDANFDMTIDDAFRTKPKTMAKKYEKVYGYKPEPSIYNPIVVRWTMKGCGFGELTFYSIDGVLHCQNEMMPRNFIKRVLCFLVDKAILDDSEEDIKKFWKRKK